ncbi:conserved hypothetical protein [Pediculus humanus corporis]|uniref:Uncharacterized protein n=1 Tax=Pediculus humanus subsp. corporis TaxID=121224 RepID=E0VH89_PEDHC|nr:uncharacterized protein Phum_PHUM203850 [Pediculus humanus corporis]EEB12745.1 conserved hypothetical protein [Pediculus humanus corporis]
MDAARGIFILLLTNWFAKPIGGVAVLPGAEFEHDNRDKMDNNDEEKENQKRSKQVIINIIIIIIILKLDYSFDSSTEKLPSELDRSGYSIEIPSERVKPKKSVDVEGKSGYFWGDKVKGFVDRLTGAFVEKGGDKDLYEVEEIKFEDLPILELKKFKVVEVQIDPKSGKLLDGQVDLKTGRINENKIDFELGKLKDPVDKEHGKKVHVIVDSLNKKLLPGQIDENKGNLIGYINPRTFILRKVEYDPKTGNFFGGKTIGFFDETTGIFTELDNIEMEIVTFDDFPMFDRDDLGIIELQIDSSTGLLLDDQVNLKTGKVNENKIDLNTGKLKFPIEGAKTVHAFIDKNSKQLLPDQFDDKHGELIGKLNPNTMKITPVKYDPKNEVFFKRDKKIDDSRSLFFGGSLRGKSPKIKFPVSEELSFDDYFINTDKMKTVQVQFDPNTGYILNDQIDLSTGKIIEKNYDLGTGKLKNPVDKKHGKIIHVVINPSDLTLKPGQISTEGKIIGKIDPQSLKLIEIDYDPQTGKIFGKKSRGFFDKFTGSLKSDAGDLEIPEGDISLLELPNFNSNDMKAIELQIDPQTGCLLDGQVDLKTNKIQKEKFDLSSGKLLNPVDKKFAKTVYAVIDPDDFTLKPGQFDKKDGKIIGRIDPKSLKLVDVDFDLKTGKISDKKMKKFFGRLTSFGEKDVIIEGPDVSEIKFGTLPRIENQNMKAVELQIDPKSGKLLEGLVDLKTGIINQSKIDVKTGKLKNPVDKKHGKIVHAIIDTKSFKLKEGQFDTKDGKLIGKIDPKTLKLIDIDYDPSTGNFIRKKIKGFFDKFTGSFGDKNHDIEFFEGEHFDDLSPYDRNDMKVIELQIDAKTMHLLDGQIDKDTGKIIESNFDLKTGKLKNPQHSKNIKIIQSIVDPKTLEIKPGQLDEYRNKVIARFNPRTSKLVEIDPDNRSGKVTGKKKGLFGRLTSFGEKDYSFKMPDIDISFEGEIPRLSDPNLKMIELQIDPKTGCLLDNQIDSNTGRIIPENYDLNTGKLKKPIGEKEVKKIHALIDVHDLKLKPGQFDLKSGKIKGYVDPKTLKLVEVEYDPKIEKFISINTKGSFNYPGSSNEMYPDSKIFEMEFDDLPKIESNTMKPVEIQIDSSSGQVTDGIIDYETGRINEDKFDVKSGKLIRPLEGKQYKTTYAMVDPKTLKLIPGQLDPVSGKIIGKIHPYSLNLIKMTDPKSESLVSEKFKSFVGRLGEPLKEQSYISDKKKFVFGDLPKIESQDFKPFELQIDPKTAKVLDNQIDYVTGKIYEKQFDLSTGKLKNPVKENEGKMIHALVNLKNNCLVPGQIDSKSGKLNAIVDHNNFKLMKINYDPKTGLFFEGDILGKMDTSSGEIISAPDIHMPKLKNIKNDIIEMPIQNLSFKDLPTFDSPDLKAVELQIDPKTGRLLDGQVDLHTGKINVPKFDIKTGKLINPVDKKLGKTVHAAIDPGTMTLHPGQFDVDTGKIVGKIDPKSLDLIEIDYDPKTGNFIGKKVRGFFGKLGKGFDVEMPKFDITLPDISFGDLPKFDRPDMKAIELQIDPKSACLLEGQVDLPTGKINAPKFDLKSGKLLHPVDKKLGKSIDAVIDPGTLTLHPGQFDVKTGKLVGKIDPKTLELIDVDFDPKSGKLSGKKGKGFFGKWGKSLEFEMPKFDVHLPEISWGELPKFDRPDLKAVELQIDPKTGRLLDGQVDLHTGKINVPKFDLKTGKLLNPVDKKLGKTIHAAIDPGTMTLHPGQIDLKSGEVIGKFNPMNFKLEEIQFSPEKNSFVLKKINVIPLNTIETSLDQTAKEKLPDVDVDLPEKKSFVFPQNTISLKVDNKSHRLLSGQVDLKHGRIITENYDLNSRTLLSPIDKGFDVNAVIDPKTFKLIPGQFDLRNGKYIGHMDPKTLRLGAPKIPDLKPSHSFKKKGILDKLGNVFHVRDTEADVIVTDTTEFFPIQLPTFERPDLKAVELQIDPKTGRLLDGQVDLHTGKINVPKFDLKTGKLINPVEKKLGKTIHAAIDPGTMTLHPGQFDVDTGKIVGKIDPKSLDLIEIDYDPKTGNFIGKKVRGFFGKLGKGFDVEMPKFDITLPDISFGDLPKFDRPDMKAIELQIDPKSACLLEGQVDLPTGKINAPKFDLKSGKLLHPVDKKLGKSIDAVIDPGTLTLHPGQFDVKTGKLVEVRKEHRCRYRSSTLTLHPGQFDVKTGKLVGKIDPKTLELIDVDFDPKSGKLSGKKGKGFFGKWGKSLEFEMPKFDVHLPEISWGELPKFDRPDLQAVELQIDPKTGRLLDGQVDLHTGKINVPKFDLKTGKLLKYDDEFRKNLVYGVVDVDTYSLLPGQFDKDGKLIGKIDPNDMKLIDLSVLDGKICRKNVGFRSLDDTSFLGIEKGNRDLFKFSLDKRYLTNPSDIKFVTLQIDRKSGVLHPNQIDLNTNVLIDSNVDLVTGKLLHPLDKKISKNVSVAYDRISKRIIPGQFNDDGKLIGKINSKTFEYTTIDFDAKVEKFWPDKVKGFFGKFRPTHSEIDVIEIPEKDNKINISKTDILLPDISFGDLPKFDRPDMKAIELQIDPKSACLLEGQVDLPTGKINAPKFDLKSGKLLHPVDKKLGKSIDAVIDPGTLTLHPGQFDVKTGKLVGKIDPKTLELIDVDFDPKSGKLSGKKGKGFFGKWGKSLEFEMPKFDVHLPEISWGELPKFDRPDLKAVELQIDPKTGRLLDGQVDLHTGKINVPKFDIKTGKLLNPVDKKLGKTIHAAIDPGTMTLHPGQFDVETGKIVGKIDPKSLDLIEIDYDPKTGNFIGKKVRGFFGKLGKGFDVEMPKFDITLPDISFGDLPKFDRPDMKAIELQIDPKSACLLEGQVDLPTGKINAPKFDLKSGKLLHPVDKKLGKSIDAVIDPGTLTLHPGQFDVKTGKLVGKIDPKTLELIDVDFDPKSGKLSGKKGKGFFGKWGKSLEFEMPKFDVHLPEISWGELPKFDRPDLKAVELQIDPKTGRLLDGQVDLHTGKINVPKFDIKTGKLLNPVDKKLGKTIHAAIDPGTMTLHPGQFDVETGKIVGKIDPKSLDLIEIDYDPKTGNFIGKKVRGFFGKLGKGFDVEMPKFDITLPDISFGDLPKFDRPDMKAIELQIDPKSACLLDGQVDLPTGKINAPKFDLKSGKLLHPVDKKLGKSIDAVIDPGTLTLHPGQFDVKTGKLVGKIDPDTCVLHPIKDLDLLLGSSGKGGNFFGKLSSQFGVKEHGIWVPDVNVKKGATLPGKFRSLGGLFSDSFKGDTEDLSVGSSLDDSLITPDGCINLNRDDIKIIEVQIDPRSGRLLEGLVDFESGKICEPKFDFDTGRLKHPLDKKLGKTIQVYINGNTRKLLPGQFDLKSGKLVGEINPRTLKIKPVEFDPKTGRFFTGKFRGLKGRLSGSLKRPDVKEIWPDLTDINFDIFPKIDSPDYRAVELRIDPNTGNLVDGFVDLHTGKINENKIDISSGKIISSFDRENGKPVYAIIDINKKTILPGQFDSSNGKLIGKLDPKSFKLLEVEYDPRNKKFNGKKVKGFFDRFTNSLKFKDFEVDLPEIVYDKLPTVDSNDVKAIEVEIDPSTGCLLKGQIDISNGKVNEEIIDLDSGRLKKPLGGKVIYALMDIQKKEIIPGQFDDIDGRIIGKLDPDTFELIEINYDPVTKTFLTGRLKGIFDKISGSFSPKNYDPEIPEVSSLSFKIPPNIDKRDLKIFELQVDPLSGRLLDGQANLKTGKIAESQFDLPTGKLKTPREKKYGTNVEVLVNQKNYSLLPGQFDINTGKLIGQINPKTFKFSPIEFEPKTSREWTTKMKDFAERLTGSSKEKISTKPLGRSDDISLNYEKFKFVDIQIDPKSGVILSDQYDLNTGKINPSKYNLKTGKLLNPHDKKFGKTISVVIDPDSLKLLPGQVCEKEGKIIGKVDNKTLKLTKVNFDIDTGKFVPDVDTDFSISSKIALDDPSHSTVISEKMHEGMPKFKANDIQFFEIEIDPKTSRIKSDQVDLETHKINPEKFDLENCKLKNPSDKEHGMIVNVAVDPVTLKLLPGQFNNKTGTLIGKIDPKTFKITEMKYDPKTKSFTIGKPKGFIAKLGDVFSVKEHKIEVPEKNKIEFIDIPDYSDDNMKPIQLQIDKITGQVFDELIDDDNKIKTNHFNLTTGKLTTPKPETQAKNVYVFIDPKTYKILPGQYDAETKKIVGIIDYKNDKIKPIEYNIKTGEYLIKKPKGFLEKISGAISKDHEIETDTKIDITLPDISFGDLPKFDRPDMKAIELQIDPKSACLLDGQVDLPTGKINAPKFDLKSGKLLHPVDKKLGKSIDAVIDPGTLTLHPGQFDVKTGKLVGKIDPKTLELIDVDFDPKSGKLSGKKGKGFFGKWGKSLEFEMPKFDVHLPEISWGELPKFDRPDLKAVELQIDPKTGRLLDGQVDLHTGKINVPKFDLKTGKLLNPVDKKLGKTIHAAIDPGTMTLHPGQFDVDTGKIVGKIDPKSLDLIEIDYDPKTGNFIGKKVRGFFGKLGKGFDVEMPKFDITLPDISFGDLPKFDRPDMKAIELQIDPKSACLLEGQVDLPTGKINAPKFDLKSGKLLHPVDKKLGKSIDAVIDPGTLTLHPGQFDVKTGKLVGKIDPKTLELIDVDFDPKSGKLSGKKGKGFFGKWGKSLEFEMPKFDVHLPEISWGELPKFDRPDLKAVELQIDPKTGRLLDGQWIFTPENQRSQI